jgi:hypothetical protein
MVKDSISHYDDMIGVDDIEDAVTELTEWMNDLDDDEREELRVLSALLEEINDYGVEGYLIRES